MIYDNRKKLDENKQFIKKVNILESLKLSFSTVFNC
jgi:hypothetical protein